MDFLGIQLLENMTSGMPGLSGGSNVAVSINWGGWGFGGDPILGSL